MIGRTAQRTRPAEDLWCELAAEPADGASDVLWCDLAAEESP